MLLSVLLIPLSYDLHDTALQTALLIAATIIAAVIPKLLEHRDRKEITYEKTMDASASSKDNTYLLNFKLSNTGNTTIHAKDYVRPIEIDLKGRKLYPTHSPFISSQTRPILNEDEQRNFFKAYPAVPQEDKLKLAPFFFQKGEALTINIMVVGSATQEDIELSARISPEAKIVKANKDFIQRREFILPFILGFVASIWFARLIANALVFWGVEPIVTVIILLYTLFLIVFFSLAYKLKIVNFCRERA